MILDLFAGPGGWDQGATMIGETDVVGLEWDRAACQTAVAAGHARIQADVAEYPTAPFVGKVGALIASPPCQAWSTAGKRKGELDRASCHRLADRMAEGDDSLDWTDWEDPRSALVCQPVRWVRDLRPPVVALEEVPAVQGLWEHFARIFRTWGYNVWVKVLCAADYGVPQTRDRVILGGSLLPVAPPEPSHSEDDHTEDLFGGSRLPWVSMAQALGWSTSDSLHHPRGAGMVERHGDRPDRNGDEPSMTVTSKSRCWVRMGNQVGATVRHITEPAPTLLFGHRANAVTWHDEQPPTRRDAEGVKMFMAAGVTGCGRPKDPETQPADTITGAGNACWVYDRPATTVAAPGYRTTTSRQNAEGSVRVTVSEAGILQSFPTDYPWQGSRSKQYEQVGNAVPPRLAAHILASLGLGSLDELRAAA